MKKVSSKKAKELLKMDARNTSILLVIIAAPLALPSIVTQVLCSRTSYFV